MINILLVEDDPILSDSISEVLGEIGDITKVFDGAEAVYEATENLYDIIVLDIMLPVMDGYEVLTRIRQAGNNVPVLFLTAKDGLEDKIKGFKKGADDYLTKPFHREELLLRVQAMLKRSLRLDVNNKLNFGNTSCFLDSHKVEVNGEGIVLNGKEYDLLVYFLQQQNRILTKEQIFQRIWGFDSETSYSVVEVYMSHLRKKLSGAYSDVVINTIRNVGYILPGESHE